MQLKQKKIHLQEISKPTKLKKVDFVDYLEADKISIKPGYFPDFDVAKNPYYELEECLHRTNKCPPSPPQMKTQWNIIPDNVFKKVLGQPDLYSDYKNTVVEILSTTKTLSESDLNLPRHYDELMNFSVNIPVCAKNSQITIRLIARDSYRQHV